MLQKKFIKTITHSLFFFILILLIRVNIFSEEKRNSISLGDIIVTDTSKDKNFQTGDVELDETTSFCTIIRSESFEGKIENLSEVIEKEAGIQVKQSGGLGSYSSVSLRGVSSQQVLVFIDGIPLNEASGGGVNLGNIPISDIELIEIYRGITPINFARASFGGVINIRTKRKGTKKIMVNSSTGFGSFNTYTLSAFLSHKPGKFDYTINADYLSSDNDYKIFFDPTPLFNNGDEGWEKRQNSQFDQNNLLSKFGFNFTPDLRIDISNQFFIKDQGIPNTNNRKVNRASLSTTRNLSNIRFTINNISPYHFNTVARADYSYKKEEWYDVGNWVGIGQQHEKYTTTTYGYNHFFEWPTEYYIFYAVFDVHQEDFMAKNLLESNSSQYNPSSRLSYSIGIGSNIILLNEKLFVNPAFRYHYIFDKLEIGTETLLTDYRGRSQSKSYFDPQIGIKSNILKWLTLKTNLAKYTREPSFFELFGDRGQFYGNSELIAETGINIDAGCEIKTEFKNKLLNRIVFSSSYFQSIIKDLIVNTYHAGGVGTSENISKASIQGIEASLIMDILKHFTLCGNYTWQEAMNYSKNDDSDNKKIPGKFLNSLMGKFEIKYKLAKIDYEFVFENGMYYDSPNNLKARDKIEHNLGASLTIWDLTFTFKAKNLGNNHYEDFNSFPQPGRSYYCTVKYSF